MLAQESGLDNVHGVTAPDLGLVETSSDDLQRLQVSRNFRNAFEAARDLYLILTRNFFLGIFTSPAAIWIPSMFLQDLFKINHSNFFIVSTLMALSSVTSAFLLFLTEYHGMGSRAYRQKIEEAGEQENVRLAKIILEDAKQYQWLRSSRTARQTLRNLLLKVTNRDIGFLSVGEQSTLWNLAIKDKLWDKSEQQAFTNAVIHALAQAGNEDYLWRIKGLAQTSKRSIEPDATALAATSYLPLIEERLKNMGTYRNSLLRPATSTSHDFLLHPVSNTPQTTPEAEKQLLRPDARPADGGVEQGTVTYEVLHATIRNQTSAP